MSNVEIFFCYNHNPEDESLVKRLEKQLVSLKRLGLINAVWYDQLVEPGRELGREIDEHLNFAQIILLFISPDFMASEKCYRNMERAMARKKREEARVIPVILRPTANWQKAPFGKLKVLPSNSNPVTLWSDLDVASLDVAEGIGNVVESISKTTENITEKPPTTLPTEVKYDTIVAKQLPEFAFTPVRTIREHLGPVATVAFSSDGERLVSDSWDKTIMIWDKFATRPLLTLSNHDEAVYSVIFSPDNRELASGGDDCTVKIWDAQNGHLVNTLVDHLGPISSVAFSPDMRVMSGSDDYTIKIWNVHSGRLVKTLTDHKNIISSIALSTDGTTLVSGSHDKTVKVWNISTGELLRTLSGHDEEVSSVALSTDGKTLVSGSYDKTVRVWNISTGELLRILSGHDDKVSSVALSADGKILVSGSHDKTLKIWNTSTGEILDECPGHTQAVLSVAFHPRERIIASGSRDKTIKIWQAPSVPVEASWTPSPAPVPVNRGRVASTPGKSPFLDGRIPGSIDLVQDSFKQRLKDFLKPRARYTRSPLFILGIIANILGAICIGVWLGRVAPSYGNETAWLWLIISLIGSEGAFWLFKYSGNKSLKGFLSLVLSVIWGFVGKAFATLIGAGTTIGFLPDANIMFVIFLIASFALHLRLILRRA